MKKNKVITKFSFVDKGDDAINIFVTDSLYLRPSSTIHPSLYTTKTSVSLENARTILIIIDTNTYLPLNF